jgi:hypothetical protein
MGNIIFGDKLLPTDLIKKQKKNLTKIINEINFKIELNNLDYKIIMNDMKRYAKDKKNEEVKMKARELLQLRKFNLQSMRMANNLKSIMNNVEMSFLTNEMAKNVANLTRFMKVMRVRIQIPNVQEMIQEYCKESENMEKTENLINDGVEMSTELNGDEDDDEETIAQQIIDEANLGDEKLLNKASICKESVKSVKIKQK